MTRSAGKRLLPGKMLIDSAPGEEQVLAFVCDKPVSVEQAKVAVASAPPKALPQREGCVVTARHYSKK